MSKSAVTQQDIFKAIQDLVKHGESPTSAKVRVQLGNKGNANTILRGIHSWYEQNGELMVKAITDPMLLASENLKKSIKRTTDQAFNAFNYDYKEQIAKLEQQKVAHTAAVEQFKFDKAQLDALIPLKDERIADLQAFITVLTDERDFARTRNKLEEVVYQASQHQAKQDLADTKTAIVVLQEQLNAVLKQHQTTEDRLLLSQKSITETMQRQYLTLQSDIKQITVETHQVLDDKLKPMHDEFLALKTKINELKSPITR